MTMEKRTNTSGLLGFIFSILAAFFCWVPYLGGFLWLMGAILSCVGLSNRPNGLAWAGFIISFAWIICFFIFGMMFNTMAFLTVYPYWCL